MRRWADLWAAPCCCARRGRSPSRPSRSPAGCCSSASTCTSTPPPCRPRCTACSSRRRRAAAAGARQRGRREGRHDRRRRRCGGCSPAPCCWARSPSAAALDVDRHAAAAGGDLVWDDARAAAGEPADPFATARVLLAGAAAPAVPPARPPPGAHRRAGARRGLHGRRATADVHLGGARARGGRSTGCPLRAAHARAGRRVHGVHRAAAVGRRPVVAAAARGTRPRSKKKPVAVHTGDWALRPTDPKVVKAEAKAGRRGRVLRERAGRLLRTMTETAETPTDDLATRTGGRFCTGGCWPGSSTPRSSPRWSRRASRSSRTSACPRRCSTRGLGGQPRAALPGPGGRVRRPDGAEPERRSDAATGRRGPPGGAGVEAAAQRLRHRAGTVSAAQLARWQADAGWFERALGCGLAAASWRAGRTAGGGRARLAATGARLGRDRGRPGQAACTCARSSADPALAAQLTPSMSLIEQLLRDKPNLSGLALANAKALIRRFVDEVAEVLRTQVQQTSVGTIDRSVPPKRVFRNLDLERTIWKNLTNWSPEDERLYVDRLFYRQTAKRTTPAAADRGGRPVRLDGRRDGQLHDPGVDLRRAAEGRRAPDRLRHPGARPDARGCTTRSRCCCAPTSAAATTGRRDGAGPAEDRRPAQHRAGLDLRLLRVRPVRAAVRRHRGACTAPA